MKNADMAAMPTQSNGGDIFCGLTKREVMAMHIYAAITGSIHDEECYLRIKSMSDRCGVKVSEWIARDAVKQTDALLAELDRTCQKS